MRFLVWGTMPLGGLVGAYWEKCWAFASPSRSSPH